MSGLHRNMLLLIGTLAITYLVQADDQEGFISLDCGLPIDASPYKEPYNGIIYTSDENFVQSGKTGMVGSNWSDYLEAYMHLRYFPEGKKNCINLNVTKDITYVIRSDFLYGNYDGLNSYPIFDLYLGPNKWVTVDLRGEEAGLSEEIIHISRSNSLQICVVKTGTSTPLISSLELRPLRNGSYLTQSGSLVYSSRSYFNNSDGYMRYPEDIHDRNWYPMFQPLEWKQITTTLNINTSNEYEPPKAAISMAIIPTNVSAPLTITWSLRPTNAKLYLYLHFAEIQALGSNETREFNILLNGQVIYGPYSPQKLQLHTLQHTLPRTCDGGECILKLVKTSKSTLPPMINSLEAFSVLELPLAETDFDDTAVIKNIQTFYELRRIDWQGDPCTPKQFLWDGLSCSYSNTSTPPRIISLDLSSKGLHGTIAPSIYNLTQLEKLDLSNNNLTGEIPEFLAKMTKLLNINLSGNNFSGSVPQALLDREKEGLTLNVKPCSNGPCKPKDEKDRNKFMIPVIASGAALVVVILVLVIIYISRKKKTAGSEAPRELSNVSETEKSANNHGQSILTPKRRFTYSDVLVMTNNFQRVLGNGGFGVVYHGYLNDFEEVAVKMLSESSTQGYKHFKAEVELLMRVHHINLVSLVGYCDEGDRLALVYEYMPNGDLKGHLSAGKFGGSTLSWASRLRIAVDAAQGLEYLHVGCKPPMIHRDVKSTNILLDQNIQAKLADFGLSRSFPIVGETHVSTVVAGTPGYLDPDYFQTNWLTEKSDIYSFGVVLLEIITNQPVLKQSRQRSHIAEWMGLMVSKGDIRSIMDPSMPEDYDVGSVWKALEVAMLCVNPSSIGRPDMSKVVNELKECLRLENYRRRGNQEMDSRSFHDLSVSLDMEGTPRAR